MEEGCKILNFKDNFGRRLGVERRRNFISVDREKRRGTDRRYDDDRRNVRDRRISEILSIDLIEGGDRRSGIDRRDFFFSDL